MLSRLKVSSIVSKQRAFALKLFMRRDNEVPKCSLGRSCWVTLFFLKIQLGFFKKIVEIFIFTIFTTFWIWSKETIVSTIFLNWNDRSFFNLQKSLEKHIFLLHLKHIFSNFVVLPWAESSRYYVHKYDIHSAMHSGQFGRKSHYEPIIFFL